MQSSPVGRSVACVALLCGVSWLAAPALAQLAPPAEDGAAPVESNVEVDPRVERALESDERAGVFLMLRDSRSSIFAIQQVVLDAMGAEFEVSHRYQSVRALAGELTRAGLALARAQSTLVAVQLDGTGTGGLKEALPAVGVDRVQAERGLTGRGVTVAVLDTGASTTHPALHGAIVAQKCFTSRACPPRNSSEGDSAEDDHNHGSNVTGIVASRGGGGVATGYAPGASIVAVKVLNSNDAGRVSDWVAGFDWVYANLDSNKVKVINASLVSTAEYASATACDRGEAALAAATRQLIDAGVTITASSGNTGHTETMTAPACNSGVIAVGATYDSNLGKQPENAATYRALGGPGLPACSDAKTSATSLACFTSTGGQRLDLLAPGTQIVSAGRGTAMSMFRGTSQAAPGVAGVAALMLECNAALTPARILEALKMTGEPVLDARSGLSYPLVRAIPALEMACPTSTPGTPMPGTTANDPPIAGASAIPDPVAGPATASTAGSAGGAGAAATSGSGTGGQPAAGLAPGQAPPTSGVALAPVKPSGDGSSACQIQSGPGATPGDARLASVFLSALVLAWMTRRMKRRARRHTAERFALESVTSKARC